MESPLPASTPPASWSAESSGSTTRAAPASPTGRSSEGLPERTRRGVNLLWRADLDAQRDPLGVVRQVYCGAAHQLRAPAGHQHRYGGIVGNGDFLRAARI